MPALEARGKRLVKSSCPRSETCLKAVTYSKESGIISPSKNCPTYRFKLIGLSAFVSNEAGITQNSCAVAGSQIAINSTAPANNFFNDAMIYLQLSTQLATDGNFFWF